MDLLPSFGRGSAAAPLRGDLRTTVAAQRILSCPGPSSANGRMPVGAPCRDAPSGRGGEGAAQLARPCFQYPMKATCRRGMPPSPTRRRRQALTVSESPATHAYVSPTSARLGASLTVVTSAPEDLWVGVSHTSSS